MSSQTRGTWIGGLFVKQNRLHGRAYPNAHDLETFFARAPAFHPNASLIKGLVCGVRVEEVEDPLMQKIRFLDELIDELAKGKAMEKILR
jgi:hypothetical protein